MKRSENWPGKAEPRIVCAANYYKSDIINEEFLIVGPRHYDLTMREQLKYRYDPDALNDNDFKIIQGFIDQFGDFHDRQEAWKIAKANGQIYRRVCGDDDGDGTLYSENLY